LAANIWKQFDIELAEPHCIVGDIRSGSNGQVHQTPHNPLTLLPLQRSSNLAHGFVLGRSFARHDESQRARFDRGKSKQLIQKHNKAQTLSRGSPQKVLARESKKLSPRAS
jgi:hypothetical protein